MTAAEARDLLTKKGRVSKYKAKRTSGPSPVGEIVYDSQAEARDAAEFELRRKAGDLKGWIPHVSFPVGKDDKGTMIRHEVDFVLIHEIRPDGLIVISMEDRKGFDTERGRMKRAMVRQAYGIDIALRK